MDFIILTNNEFFRLVNDGADSHAITTSVYNEFIKEVCAVCCAPPSERHHLVFTLAYIETELGSLHETYPQSPVLRASDAEIRPDPSATTTHPKIRHSNNTFPLDGQPRRAGRDHLCPR